MVTQPSLLYSSTLMFQHCNVAVEAQFKNDFQWNSLILHEGFAGCAHITIPLLHWEAVFHTTSMEIIQRKLCFSSDLQSISVEHSSLCWFFPLPSPSDLSLEQEL